jgi:hypothetical protein
MLDVLLEAPVIVKVLGTLALILAANRFCRHLFVSVTVGAIVLAFWSGYSAREAAGVAWWRFSSASNLLLMLIIFQVIWLSSQMAATGVMRDLVGAVRRLVSRRAAMAVLPAAIGFLPMPGGALFSAPLVDSCDADGCISPGLKAQTNHWFRHVWEYWWPLYPGLLLTLEITGLEVWQFALVGVPLSLCAMAGGWFFLLRRIEPEGEADPVAEEAGAGDGVFRLMLPIAVVIGCYAAVRLCYAGVRAGWPEAPRLNRYVPMVIGLCAAMAVLQRQRPLGREAWRRVLLSARAANMAAIVAAVRVYGAFIESELPGGGTLAAEMHAEMEAWGIPLILLLMLLPFVSGLATGLTIGFVGPVFPIIFSLPGQGESATALLATGALAFACGFMGTMLSPVHVCLVVSSEHFRTRVLRNTVGLLRPAAVVVAGGVLLRFLLG